MLFTPRGDYVTVGLRTQLLFFLVGFVLPLRPFGASPGEETTAEKPVFAGPDDAKPHSEQRSADRAHRRIDSREPVTSADQSLKARQKEDSHA